MFNEIDNIIAEHKYSKHSFIKHVESGTVKKENLKSWAIQKYFQVYHQNCGFSAIHANCEYEDVRQFEVEQLIEEETNIKGGSESHYNMMKRFCYALNANDQDFQQTPIGAPVKEHIKKLKYICLNEHFVYGLLAFYIFESQTPESAMRMYHTFKQQFNFDDTTLEWFLVHGSADIEHSQQSKNFIMKYAHEVQDFIHKKNKFVIDGVKAWNQLQDYYYSLLMK